MQAGKGTGAHGGASSTGEATEEDDEEEQARTTRTKLASSDTWVFGSGAGTTVGDTMLLSLAVVQRHGRVCVQLSAQPEPDLNVG